MEATHKKRRFPGVGWLSSRLSRKVIAGLVVVALLSWLAMSYCFLAYLGSYSDRAYDAVLAEADETARRAGAFLEGSGGDLSAFQDYLEANGVGCTLRDDSGRIIFEHLAFAGDDVSLAASGGAPVHLADGRTMDLRVWVRSLGREEVRSTLGRGALPGLFVLNFCVFIILAVMIYLLVLTPVIRLRKTMRRYYESGEEPERTGREDEIGRLQNTFADLVGVVEQKEQAERRLIASISHDIKTPLTSVMGYSERLLSAELPPEKQRQYLQSVYDKAVSIQSIVDEFDDYIDVGLRDSAPMVLTTAKELCTRLQKEFEAELLDAGAALAVSCTCPQDQLICNWEHMRRFFGNLIGNSFQHAGSDHLALSLACRREGGQIVFLFQDNGKGVPEALLGQIFEPLYTSDRGRKVSGLGLSICKSIITAHGGAVSAENAPEGGLLIRASLPALDQ